MTSRYRVFGLRFALGAALLASACQQDSNAEFDDRNLTSPDVGGSADSGGSSAVAGESPGGGSDAGGSEASGGASQAGKSSAGAAGGSSSAGKGGMANAGGKAGANGGGAASQAGKTGQGGAAGTANGGGIAGSPNPPEPITLETADIDDTHVASCMPQQNFGEAERVSVDDSLSCRYEALIDVPRLELPAAAVVSNATLTLTCSNAGAAITVAYANEVWKELAVRWNTRPEVGTTIGTITCAEEGTVAIDLTSAFKAWQAGEHAANGIYLRTDGTNGTDFASSEADKTSSRPQLSITYTLPVE
jgi:hypothetical protein